MKDNLTALIHLVLSELENTYNLEFSVIRLQDTNRYTLIIRDKSLIDSIVAPNGEIFLCHPQAILSERKEKSIICEVNRRLSLLTDEKAKFTIFGANIKGYVYVTFSKSNINGEVLILPQKKSGEIKFKNQYINNGYIPETSQLVEAEVEEITIYLGVL